MTRAARCRAGLWLASALLATTGVRATDYFEGFDAAGQPGGPPGTSWTFLGEIHPGQSAWADFVPGDGLAHVTVDPNSANDLDATNPFQYVAFGLVGPSHRLEARMQGAVVPGLAGFIFTYWEDSTFDEIDIELVADDGQAPPATHPVDPPDGWTDARFNTWGNSDTTTYLPETSHKQAIVDEDGTPVSHLDGQFHVYTIEWLPAEVRFTIDGVLQDVITDPVADSASEVILGFRDLPWAGGFDWTGTRTMLIDWFNVEPIDAGSPFAAVDRYAVTTSGSLETTAAQGVLANDQGSGLTALLVSDVQHGTLGLAADGSFSYSPEPGFTGLDQFVYRADDLTGAGASNASPVWLRVEDEAQPACANRVANASFETGGLAPWTGSHAGAAGEPHAGSWSARLGSGTSASGAITQVVSGLQPGTGYRLGAWLKSDNEGDGWIRVSAFGGAEVEDYHYSTPVWGRAELQFTTGATHTSATVTCYAEPYSWAYPSSVVFCDDVELVPVGCLACPDAEELELTLAKIGPDGADLAWTPVAGTDSYALTRGDLGSLGQGQYGSCLASALPEPGYADLDPAASGGQAYLVQADSDACGPGSLGHTSEGVERVNDDPQACP